MNQAETTSYLSSASKLLEDVSMHHLREEKAIAFAENTASVIAKQMTKEEVQLQSYLHAICADPIGIYCLTSIHDQAFRPKNSKKIAEHIRYLLNLCSVPKHLSLLKQFQFFLFRHLHVSLESMQVPYLFRKQSPNLFADKGTLQKELDSCLEKNIYARIEKNQDFSLGKKQGLKRVTEYIALLSQKHIRSISLSVNDLFAPISLYSHDDTFHFLEVSLKAIFNAAMENTFLDLEGNKYPKTVNLLICDSKVLEISKDLIFQILEKKEFDHFPLTVTLSAAFPVSHSLQKEFLSFSRKRIAQEKEKLELRLIRGKNIPKEVVSSSLTNNHFFPFMKKSEIDANFKKMASYSLSADQAPAMPLTIVTHNLFDIGYLTEVARENKSLDYLTLECAFPFGIPIQRAIADLSIKFATTVHFTDKKYYHFAFGAYLRTLSEKETSDMELFNLNPQSESFETSQRLFSKSIKSMPLITEHQKTTSDTASITVDDPFTNETDTLFRLAEKRKWGSEICNQWKEKIFRDVPLSIGKKLIESGESFAIKKDPLRPSSNLYQYRVANEAEIDEAIFYAQKGKKKWTSLTPEERSSILHPLAQKLRDSRSDMIGILMSDSGKTIEASDREVTDSIDFCEHLFRNYRRWTAMQDVKWTPLGIVAIFSSKESPLAHTICDIFASLITGNVVLLSPPKELTLLALYIAKMFWEINIPREVLQFIPVSSSKDLEKISEINALVYSDQVNAPLAKSCALITNFSDQAPAVKDLLYSSFTHSGQKKCTVGLAIIEKEIFDSKPFQNLLESAASSIATGSGHDAKCRVTPLLSPLNPAQELAMKELEPHEKWLLKPVQDSQNPNLWSPGIKFGIQKGGFLHQNAIFAPLLGIMRAENFEHAIELANSSSYRETLTLFSLNPKEQIYFERYAKADHLFINKSSVRPRVERQPSRGALITPQNKSLKRGWTNYLLPFMTTEEIDIPKEKHPVNTRVNHLSKLLETFDFSAQELGIWYASIASYAYFWQKLKRKEDSTKIIGEDNLKQCLPKSGMCLRITKNDNPLDFMRVFALCLTIDATLFVSIAPNSFDISQMSSMLPQFAFVEEKHTSFIEKIESRNLSMIRFLSDQPDLPKELPAITDPVLSNGRIEIMHYVKEVSISIRYDRFGNLGLRDKELRKPLFS